MTLCCPIFNFPSNVQIEVEFSCILTVYVKFIRVLFHKLILEPGDKLWFVNRNRNEGNKFHICKSTNLWTFLYYKWAWCCFLWVIGYTLVLVQGANTHLIGSWPSREDNSSSGSSVSSCNMLKDAEDISEGWRGGDDVASSDRFEADEHKDLLDTPEKEADSEWSPHFSLKLSSSHNGTFELQGSPIS